MAAKFELNSTTPAPPSGKANIIWQADASGNVSGYTAGVVASVFGRTGVVAAQSGDYAVAQVTGAVPDTRTIIAGSGLTGGGALSGNVTLSASIAGIQTPWTQNINGGGYTLANASRVTVNGVNAAGAEAVSGLILDRPYGSVGDSMDIVWPGLARMSANAVGGGEGALIFYAQTAAGDGTQNEVLRVNGNHQVQVPQGWLEVWKGTPNGFVGGGGAWPFLCINYQNAANTGGAVFATTWGAADFASSPLTVGSVNAGYGSYREFFGVRATGLIVLASVVAFNFTTDLQASQNGIPVGGVYHNAGAMRIRIA